MGTGCLGIGIRLLEKLYGLLAIVCDVNFRLDPGFLKRLPDQENVRLAVLSNQNLPMVRLLWFIKRGA